MKRICCLRAATVACALASLCLGACVETPDCWAQDAGEKMDIRAARIDRLAPSDLQR